MPIPEHQQEFLRQATELIARQNAMIGDQNSLLLAALNQMPGGPEMLRAELGKFGVAPEVLDRWLRGEVEPGDGPILAGLNLARN